MKKNLFVTVLICVFANAYSQTKIAIIPQPASITEKAGNFLLKDNAVINITNGDNNAFFAADYLSKKINTATGYKTQIRKNGIAANINLVLLKQKHDELGKEGYMLSVNPKQVNISANTAAGLFYGIQSFIQLLPPQIESKTVVKNIVWQAPCADIKDYPRFGWRGLMIDVARHFFTKQEVKEFIDDMVKYKYNLLHIHLTDDQGWRIEIKSLPLLTKVGAWNVKREGTFNNFAPVTPDEPRSYGGFYTQDDIRELVKYAKDRFVDILPEIEMPGHSLASVASYPELSCNPDSKFVVNSGEPFMSWSDDGFAALMDNTLSPANEKVYQFADKVFTEVAQLFPFEYIHMGGDECAKNFWEKSAEVKALMQKENLKDMNEVQSYFVKRIEKIIENKGKKMIGWDEILEGGLAPNAIVMSWRGMRGGIEAAKMQHQVVMTPSNFVYLDYMQSDAINEPPVYATLRLKKSYEFEPVPKDVDAKFIKGGQGNVWTEQIYNSRHLEYMTWPRAFSIAETLWSPAEKKEWKNFVEKTEAHFKRLDAAEINYARSMYDPAFHARTNEKGETVVAMNTETGDLSIHYSFDNSFPDKFYPAYEKPLVVPKDAVVMRVITYRDGKPMGRMITMPVAELKRRAKEKEDNEE